MSSAEHSGSKGLAPTESPDAVETLVAARFVLDPEDMLLIWQSAMTIPAAWMAECLEFTTRQLQAQAAVLETVTTRDAAAAEPVRDVAETSPDRSGLAA
ncbi:hypothetical protein [Methylopila sp. M107]|uniref:hypothetical protein n=1 Tax=Methylopila sp. M107 TaxID=1101190 RepID=UPI000367D0E1|nr:hypothetical protein [Methylopila sp. M107]